MKSKFSFLKTFVFALTFVFGFFIFNSTDVSATAFTLADGTTSKITYNEGQLLYYEDSGFLGPIPTYLLFVSNNNNNINGYRLAVGSDTDRFSCSYSAPILSCSGNALTSFGNATTVSQDFTINYDTVTYVKQKYQNGANVDVTFTFTIVPSYDDGYIAGESAGYSDGYQAGLQANQDTIYQSGYNNGYSAGESAGLTTGYNNGYSKGESAGLTTGYNNGYSAGYSEGESAGYNNGYDAGLLQSLKNIADDIYEINSLSGYLPPASPLPSTTCDSISDCSDSIRTQITYLRRGDNDFGYNNGYSAGESAGYLDGYNNGYLVAENYGLNIESCYVDGLVNSTIYNCSSESNLINGVFNLSEIYSYLSANPELVDGRFNYVFTLSDLVSPSDKIAFGSTYSNWGVYVYFYNGDSLVGTYDFSDNQLNAISYLELDSFVSSSFDKIVFSNANLDYCIKSFGLYNSDSFDTGYNLGYDEGYDDAIDDGGHNSLVGMIGAIFTGPVTMLTSIFDFEFLGINLVGVILSFLTLIVVVWLIKKFI